MQALPAPTHSSERQAGEDQVHEAVVATEAPAAGPGQHLLDHLGKSSKTAEWLGGRKPACCAPPRSRGSVQPIRAQEGSEATT